MTQVRRLVATGAAVAVAAAVLAGCSHPATTTGATLGAADRVPPTSAPLADASGRTVTGAMPSPAGWLPPFTQTMLRTQDPAGTGPQIALRFLRDLQAGDYLAAAQQLSAGERLTVSVHTQTWLHRVMTDVLDNAALLGASRCTSADAVNTEAAVVTCGSRQTVVHVRGGWLPGVQINSYFPHDDVYLGPHTHAYTRYDI
jgi:hypothetical protein